MKLGSIWTLATTEMRSGRRLTRTWVLIVGAILVCTMWYLQVLEFSSWPSAPSGWDHDEMSARYRGATMLNTFVAMFSFGIIFLAFDIQARDTQNRMREVMDSQPVSNIEIIVGRVTGIILLLLIPCVVFVSLVGCYESISLILGVRYRMGFQPMYVISFVVWNIIPNLLFWGAFVACLAVLVRIRVLVALIALGALIGSLWLVEQIPIRMQESLSQYLGSALFPSDLAPVSVTPMIVGSRIALLLVSISLLLFAASLMQRTERRRTMNTYSGVAAVSIGTVIFFGLVLTVQSSESLKREWTQVHRQQYLSAFPDVQKLTGKIELDPGRKVTLDVTLTVLPPTANTTDSVIFSLNPGYKIQHVSIDGEQTTAFSFEKGILKLPTNLLFEESHKVRIQATGIPDDRFAYLDQARDFQRLADSSVRGFGLRSSIFHDDFVALMPGTVWYPISGSAIDRDNVERRSRDLFTTDLTVSVPRDWLVATVGKREYQENETRQTFQFTNHAPVPELALFASNFERRSMSIDGVEFEVLFSKKHLKNLDLFAPLGEQVRDWIVGRMNSAKSLSLEYPYEAFYVVEVPSNLRIYGGGWRMDSVLQPPSMMLVRETNFPTEEFEGVIGQWELADSNSPYKTVAMNLFERYFEDDQQGGNPFAGIARNFVSHQVSATGRGATALQYLLDQLSNELITQMESSYVISETEYGSLLPSIWFNSSPQLAGSTFTNSRRMNIATLPSTWKLMDQIALFDLDFDVNPILAYRVLLTKGRAIARSIIAYYGAEKVGSLLSQLQANYRGQSFTLEDLVSVASSIGIDLNDWVVRWVEDIVLPGYVTTTPTVSKLIDFELGNATYQTSFILHNLEPILGIVRVVWSEHPEPANFPESSYSYSEPIILKGRHSKQIAIESPNSLTEIWVEPYLSYNRTSVEVMVPDFVEDDLLESETLPFVADIDWKPANTTSITTDDLDTDFSIVTLGSNKRRDGGIPIRITPRPGEWHRQYHSQSFGQYRRTHVRVWHGDGTSAALFKSSLPQVGRWKLEFFVSTSSIKKDYLHTRTHFDFGFGFGYERRVINRQANPNAPEEHYRLEISDGVNKQKVKFDIANADVGWNEVGTFELGSSEIEVLLSDWAGHEEVMVYADAIRWSPSDSD